MQITVYLRCMQCSAPVTSLPGIFPEETIRSLFRAMENKLSIQQWELDSQMAAHPPTQRRFDLLGRVEQISVSCWGKAVWLTVK